MLGELACGRRRASRSSSSTYTTVTRLPNAFSKNAEAHANGMSIYFMHYNFVRIHQTLGVTPAMAAGRKHVRFFHLSCRRTQRDVFAERGAAGPLVSCHDEHVAGSALSDSLSY